MATQLETLERHQQVAATAWREAVGIINQQNKDLELQKELTSSLARRLAEVQTQGLKANEIVHGLMRALVQNQADLATMKARMGKIDVGGLAQTVHQLENQSRALSHQLLSVGVAATIAANSLEIAEGSLRTLQY